jgi:hypothetical protein
MAGSINGMNATLLTSFRHDPIKSGQDLLPVQHPSGAVERPVVFLSPPMPRAAFHIPFPAPLPFLPPITSPVPLSLATLPAAH